jgi:hypothetical protein
MQILEKMLFQIYGREGKKMSRAFQEFHNNNASGIFVRNKNRLWRKSRKQLL